ncbi:MAG: FAD-binding oxidoreductase [Bacteroidota bacterium]|nr:FAD-binding oxidoreductase [Bacteroidota bacterium]
MEEYIVKIVSIEQVTHDVRRFRFEKPEGYFFLPGQATDVSINKPGFRDRKNPFTFTCLNSAPYLEFTIKIYSFRNGVTAELGKVIPGDELIIRDVWGAINYKGKGVFIAGGAGITPFIAILRDLHQKNQIDGNMLIFANKTKADIILENEFRNLLGDAFINILSEEKAAGHQYGYISKDFLKQNISDFNQNFYVCGPPPLMDSVLKQLAELGVAEKSITLEL